MLNLIQEEGGGDVFLRTSQVLLEHMTCSDSSNTKLVAQDYTRLNDSLRHLENGPVDEL